MATALLRYWQYDEHFHKTWETDGPVWHCVGRCSFESLENMDLLQGQRPTASGTNITFYPGSWPRQFCSHYSMRQLLFFLRRDTLGATIGVEEESGSTSFSEHNCDEWLFIATCSGQSRGTHPQLKLALIDRMTILWKLKKAQVSLNQFIWLFYESRN